VLREERSAGEEVGRKEGEGGIARLLSGSFDADEGG